MYDGNASDDSEASRGYYSDYSPELIFAEKAPWIEILEQPGDFRYRYEKEKYHGHIFGTTSPQTKKRNLIKFPSIKVHNYHRDVIVRCWLIETNLNDGPKAHVHKLARKEPKHEMQMEPLELFATNKNGFTVTFDYMYIIHAVTSDDKDIAIFNNKKNWLESGTYEAPCLSKHMNYNSKSQAIKSMDKNQSLLYFEVFDSESKEKICEAVSTKIKNLHNAETAPLKIVNYSRADGSDKGKDQVFMFVEKITKDVEVRFVYTKDGKEVWKQKADYGPQNVHHQYGIVFLTPPFPNCTCETRVDIELYRKTDNNTSNRVPFTYKPDGLCGMNVLTRKRDRSPDRDMEYYTVEDSSVLQNKRLRSVESRENVDLLNQIYPSEFPEDMDPLYPSFSSSDLPPLDFSGWMVDPSFFRCLADALSDSSPLIELNIAEDLSFDNLSETGEGQCGFTGEAQGPSFTPKAQGPSFTAKSQGPSFTAKAQSLSGHPEMSSPYSSKRFQKNRDPKSNDLVKRKLSELDELFKITKLIYNLKDIKEFERCLANLGNINASDLAGNTLLLIAAGLSREAVEILLTFKDIKKDVQNLCGDNAVLCATRSGQSGILEFLLENKFDPNTQNYKNGETALHIAVSQGNLLLTKILLKYNANPLLDNFAAESPYDYSLNCGNPDVKKLLYLKFQQLFCRKKTTAAQCNIESADKVDISEHFIKLGLPKS